MEGKLDLDLQPTTSAVSFRRCLTAPTHCRAFALDRAFRCLRHVLKSSFDGCLSAAFVCLSFAAFSFACCSMNKLSHWKL
ncbi:rCG63202, partial [Rattus norvegicus]